MNKIFGFEKLMVWQESRELAVMIYKTTKNFPTEEKSGLTSQMRRCAVSIPSNISEGTGKHSFKDKARFTEIAYSSALELLNQLIISNDLEFILDKEYQIFRDKISKISAMLDGLYKSQIKNT